MILFSGNANKKLAASVAHALDIELGDAELSRFADGEIFVQINQNVRGSHTYILQSLSRPTNDNIMELAIMADALRRASAGSITAVIPYYGYARQDRRVRSARVAISARVVADILCSVGINRVLTIDLHAEQIQGFFHIPVDNIYASSLFVEDIRSRFNTKQVTIVSPDIGGVQRARAIAKPLSGDLAIIDKRRLVPNQSEVMNVIGNIENKHCIIVDDIVDTGGTLMQAAASLKERGAKSVRAYITHPVLSHNAADKIELSPLDELVITDTIELPNKKFKHIRQLSTASLLAECMRRIKTNQSINEIMTI